MPDSPPAEDPLKAGEGQSPSPAPSSNAESLTHEAAVKAVQNIKSLPVSEASQVIENNVDYPEIKRINEDIEFRRESHLEFTSGPIPPPSMIADYVKVYPEAAKVLFGIAEKEQAHAHKMEATVQSRATWDMILSHVQRFMGLGSGFFIAWHGLNLGFSLGMSGHEIAAAAIGAGGLASLVSVFVRGRESQAVKKPNPSAGLPQAPNQSINPPEPPPF